MRIAMTSLAEKAPYPQDTSNGLSPTQDPQSTPGPSHQSHGLNRTQGQMNNASSHTRPRMEHLYDTEGRTRVGSKGA